MLQNIKNVSYLYLAEWNAKKLWTFWKMFTGKTQ